MFDIAPLRAWIGKLVDLRFRGRAKTQSVRIVDVEIAPSETRHHSGDIWFWARYS